MIIHESANHLEEDMEVTYHGGFGNPITPKIISYDESQYKANIANLTNAKENLAAVRHKRYETTCVSDSLTEYIETFESLCKLIDDYANALTGDISKIDSVGDSFQAADSNISKSIN